MEQLRDCAPMVVRDPTILLSVKQSKLGFYTLIVVSASIECGWQYTLMQAFQAALIAALKSMAPVAPGSQRTSISETPQSGEQKQLLW